MSYPIADSINLAPLTTATGSYPPSLASLSTTTNDDHVFLAIACSATSGTFSISGSGWSIVRELDVTSGQRMAICVCKVAAGTVAAPTITLSAGTGLWGGMAWVERDADTTTPVSNSLGTGGGAAVSSLALGTFTPSNNDSRVVYFATARNAQVRMLESAAVCDGYQSITDGTTILSMGLASVAQTTAADANATAYCSASVRTGIIAIAIKNKTSGQRSRHATSGLTKLNWSGNFGSVHDTGSWSIATSRTIDGIAVSATDPTRSVDVTGPSDIGSWDAIVTAVSTTGAWQGKKYTMSADTSFVGKMFSIEWLTGSPSAALGENGIIIVFEDNTEANWVAFKLSKKSGLVGSRLYTSVIDVKNATPYASGGTLDDANLFSVVRKISILVHRYNSSTAGQTVTYRHMALIDKTTLVGGNSTRSLDINYLRNVLHGWGWQNIVGGESPAATLRSDVQIGDGSTTTYYDATGTLHAFPDAYNENTQRSVNIPANKLDLTIKAGASDTINLTATSVSATQQQNLTFDAATSGSATQSTSGAAIIGMLPTWQSVVPANNVTHSGCGIVAFDACTATNVTVTDGVAQVAASVSDGFEDAGGTYIGNSTCIYGLRIAAAGTIDLDGTTFSGFTKDIDVTATTGTVTINLATGTATPTYQTAGATVTIVAPQPTLSATVLASSRVVLYNDTTDAELDNTAPAGTSWSKVITSGASAGDTLTLHVFKEGYEEFSTSFLYSGDDTTILVSQTTDANIQSLRTELGISDYTTITEFALDITGTVEIDADDADGSTQKARLVIWYNGVLTTENGARYLRGAISILSTAAFRINTSVLDLKIENISVTKGLNFTDTERRLYRDDGAAIYATASAPGSIQNDYSGVPDTVETGVSGLTGSESAQLSAIAAATSDIPGDVLTAAQTTPIHADVRKVTGSAISGSGTEADPWGPT